MLSLIAAVSDNGVIGKGNRLPWKLSSDLRRFKKLTMGHALIVGRKTFESIGRPLPGRHMIVVTRSRQWSWPGVRVAHSIGEALEYTAGDDEPFIGGGAQIYALSLPLVERMYLTRVHTTIDGDARFPDIDEGEWSLTSEERYSADADNQHATTFRILRRIPAGG